MDIDKSLDYKSAATALSVWLSESRVKQSINPAVVQSSDDPEDDIVATENEELKDRERELYRKLCFLIAQARPELIPLMCDCVLVLGGTMDNVATFSYILENNKNTQVTKSVNQMKKMKSGVKSRTTTNLECKIPIQINKVYTGTTEGYNTTYDNTTGTYTLIPNKDLNKNLPRYLRSNYLGVLNEAIARKTEKRIFNNLQQLQTTNEENTNNEAVNNVAKSLAMKPIDIMKRSIILNEMVESGNQTNSELYSLRLADLEVEAENIRSMEKKLIVQRNNLLKRISELQEKLDSNRKTIQYYKDILEH